MTTMTTTKSNKPLAAVVQEPEEVVTPNDLLEMLYPGLAAKHGLPFRFEFKNRKFVSPDGESIKRKVWVPLEMNERYFAAIITAEANEEDPAVFDQEENWWYRFKPEAGFYIPVKPEALHEQLTQLLFALAQKCRELKAPVDTEPLEFKFQKTAVLAPIVTKAIGIAAIKGDFWDRPLYYVPVKNGVYSINDNTLYTHSPNRPYRGIIQARYNPKSKCPRWDEFVNNSLPDEDDRQLLQKLFGLLVLGYNLPQIMVLMYGAAQSGKGTIARIMASLAGEENTTTLRTNRLDGRFEMGRLRHKLMLYAPDVAQDFLNVAGAYLLKAITGEDPISPEYKNSNAVPAAKPIGGIPIITSNSRLRIRFEGDKEAYRRRLIPIQFNHTVEEKDRVTGLSKELMDEEGSGIFNYALEGVKILSRDGGNMCLTERQRVLRDKLLDESESYVAFAREGLVDNEGGQLTVDDAWKGYVKFCTARGWAPVTLKQFQSGFNQAMADFHGLTQSHDLVTGSEHVCRGWKGVKVVPSARRNGVNL